MKKLRYLFPLLSLLLIGALLLPLVGCAGGSSDSSEPASSDNTSSEVTSSENPSSDTSSTNTEPVSVDDAFRKSQTDLAVKLFRRSYQNDTKRNTLLSPLSVSMALSMTANGAGGQTKTELEQLLGGGVSLEELNQSLLAYTKSLPDGEGYKFHLANSIWLRDDDRLSISEDFLKANQDLFDAQVYQKPFDDSTAQEINSWVKEHTDGMIEKIINQINPDEIMYLINALAFDAEWAEPYEKDAATDDTFTSIDGKKQDVKMMHSTEWTYLSDDNATGFIKPYKNGTYSFAALLPNEGISLEDYIASLTGESLQKTFKNASGEEVVASMPKFKFDYDLSMKEVLSDLGIPTAFDSAAADFSGIGVSKEGNLFIGDVLHKTHIDVDENGTKAAAVTVVTIKEATAMLDEPEPKYVKLDRPFVFMILDNENQLPIFIGAVTDLSN